MPVREDAKYEAKVVDAFLTESKEKGTAGLFIAFDTEDGSIEHTFWITPNTLDRLMENLGKCFGVTNEQLKDAAFLDVIGDALRGKTVAITTEGEEYRGETRVKVKWMNPAGFRPKKVEGKAVSRIAALFSGGPVSSPAYTQRRALPPSGEIYSAGITDDDVPF